jgi:hydroxyacylglutathione hydrolase
MNVKKLVSGPLAVNTWCVPVAGGRMMIVDPGGNPASIIAYLNGEGLKPALVVLTHGHFDHLLALPELARAYPELPVAIHSADSSFLGRGSLERHRAFLGEDGDSGLLGGIRADFPPATLFLEDGQPVPLIDGWAVMHTPGHSEGSVCLYNAAEKTLIAGDTLFFQGMGRTDFEGGSSEKLFASLSRLATLPPDTVVLPGHGRVTTIGAELG